MTRFSRCHVVLLLVLLLLPAALQAAEPLRAGEPLRSASAATAWDVLARVLSYLTGAQLDNGCWVDPSGRCLTGTSPTTAADNGCSVDPDGRCRN